MKISYCGYLYEMAKPTEYHLNTKLYHGTSEENAKEILQSGYLKGRLVQGRAQQAPLAGYVYVTKDVTYAAGYAGAYRSWGSGSRYREGELPYTAYVFVIDSSKISEVLVDEDVLGELGTSRYVKKYSQDLIDYLKRIALQVATPIQLKKAQDGYMSYQSAIGKKMAKVIPSDKMQWLSRNLPHLAVKGVQEVPIIGYYTLKKSIFTPEEFFNESEYHEYKGNLTVDKSVSSVNLKSINESVKYGQGEDKIINAGTVFFHGTCESIQGELSCGTYDQVLWTTRNPTIAKTYITYSDRIRTVSTKNLAYPPMQSKEDKIFKNSLGISYDAKYKNGLLHTYKILSPQYFIDLSEKRMELSKRFNQYFETIKAKETEYVRLLNEDDSSQEYLDKLEEEIYQMSYEFKQFKLGEFRQYDFKLMINQWVNAKLIELGYKPESTSNPEADYLWDLNYDDEGNIMKAGYKTKGRLYIVKPKRDMKMYDVSIGEGDLNDVQYHSLDLFRQLEDMGYDGVIIDDFAQHRYVGNVNHISYGFFDSALKDLNTQKYIDNVEHPEEIFEKVKYDIN